MAKEIIFPFSELKGTLNDAPIEPTLEITENGIYDVKGYSYADVNVAGGSSDFSTAEVTFIGGTSDDDKYPTLDCITIYQEKLEIFGGMVQSGDTEILTLVLYKGEQHMPFTAESIESYTGSVIIDQDDQVIVTGDAEITIYTPTPI